MRRPIAANFTPLLLFLVILVSLVACSTSASTTSFPTVPAPAAMPPTTGVLQLEPTLTVAPPLTTGSIPDATLVPTTLQLTEKQDSVAAEASAIPCGLAPDGVVVSAWVDDEDLAQGTVINGSYKLLVHQLDSQLAGKVISFRVGAVAAGQTAVWTQGSADELNLTAASRKDILVIPNEINESGPEGRRVTIPIPPHLFVGTVALICPKGRDGRDSELTAEVGNSPTPARTYPPTFAKRTVAPIPNTLAPTPTPTPIAKPSSVEQDTRELEELIHALVNTERRKHQLTPLISDIELALIARGHSQDMAANGYFNHQNLIGDSPSKRATRQNYVCRKDYGSFYTEGVAENIFQNWLFSSTTWIGPIPVKDYKSEEEIAESTVEGWMQSPGHKSNILEANYDRVGTGVAVSKDEKVLITQNFC